MSKKTKLYNDDCLKILPQLIEDNTKVDLILTDPPYGTVKGLNLDGWKNSTKMVNMKLINGDCIGIELEKKYYDIAKERLKNYQTRLI